MQLQQLATGREILYTGPGGARFSVEHQLSINAGAFTTIFTVQPDYTGAGATAEAVASGSSTGGSVIAPGGSFTFEFRIRIILLAGAAGVVSSPGMTFTYFGVAP
jgi:hypothetical protein